MPLVYTPAVDKTSTQHEGTEDLAINNTFMSRFLTLLALKTSAFFYHHEGVCFPISKYMIVKTGRWVHLTEAATIQFVAKNTSLPVPKVYCSFIHKNRAYIVIERIQGVEAPKALGGLSKDSREKIISQLKRMFQELRALKPPLGTGVESCAGRSLRDSRIPRSLPRLGPFKTIQEFHLWLRESLDPQEIQNREDNQDWRDIKDMAAKQDRP